MGGYSRNGSKRESMIHKRLEVVRLKLVRESPS